MLTNWRHSSGQGSLKLLFAIAAVVCCSLNVQYSWAAEPGRGANRLSYLDEFSDPYVFDGNSPRLTTPQWVGESGVDLVVTLGIDDMRKAELYEAFLRPILERLKKIDGRAPVSIFTNTIDPPIRACSSGSKKDYRSKPTRSIIPALASTHRVSPPPRARTIAVSTRCRQFSIPGPWHFAFPAAIRSIHPVPAPIKRFSPAKPTPGTSCR